MLLKSRFVRGALLSTAIVLLGSQAVSAAEFDCDQIKDWVIRDDGVKTGLENLARAVTFKNCSGSKSNEVCKNPFIRSFYEASEDNKGATASALGRLLEKKYAPTDFGGLGCMEMFMSAAVVAKIPDGEEPFSISGKKTRTVDDRDVLWKSAGGSDEARGKTFAKFKKTSLGNLFSGKACRAGSYMIFYIYKAGKEDWNQLLTDDCVANKVFEYAEITDEDKEFLQEAGDGVFGQVDYDLDDSMYGAMTSAQVAQFGVKKTEKQCHFIKLDKLTPDNITGVTKECFSKRLERMAATTSSPAALDLSELQVAALASDILKLVTSRQAKKVDPKTWALFSVEQATSLPDAACKGIPEEAYPLVRKVNADCFHDLNAKNQIFVLNSDEKRSMTDDLLRRITSVQMKAILPGFGWEKFFELSNEQFRLLGASVAPIEHPCVHLSKDNLIALSKLEKSKHMPVSCLAATPFYAVVRDIVEEGEKDAFPPEAWAGLRMEQIKSLFGANFLKEGASGSFMAAMTSRAGFCADLTIDGFRELSGEAFVISADCFMAFSFKGALTAEDFKRIQPAAFSTVDKEAQSKFDPALLSPEQLTLLGSAVTEADKKPSAAFTRAHMAAFTTQQYAVLTADHVAHLRDEAVSAIPVAMVVSLKPEALRKVTARWIKALPEAAFKTITVEQFVHLGADVSKDSAEAPHNAITPEMLASLPSAARAACVKHVMRPVDGEAAASGWLDFSTTTWVIIGVIFGVVLVGVIVMIVLARRR